MTALDRLVERACRRDEVIATHTTETHDPMAPERPARDYRRVVEDNPVIAEEFGGEVNLEAWLRYLDA